MNDEDENFYRPPESPIQAEPAAEFLESTALRDKLIAEQSFTRVFLVAFAGSIVGVVLMATLLIAPGIFFLAFALPGALSGFALRSFGRAIDVRYRVFAFVVSLLMYWLLILSLHPSSLKIGFILSLSNAIVAGYMSRRALSPVEEAAVYLRRMRME